MNKNSWIVVPFLLLMAAVSFADDTIKEWTGETACSKCDFPDLAQAKCGSAMKVGDKVYILTGPVLKKEMPGCCGEKGTYKIKGKLSADSKSIEVTEIKKLASKE